MRKARGPSLGAFCAVFLLTGCSPAKPAVKTGFDFSKLRRLSVLPFEGTGGQAVADEFVRELVGKGFEVTDVQHPAELVLKGSVTDYKATSALMVFIGNTALVSSGGQSVTVKNPVLSMNSSQLTPEGKAPGVTNAQMAAVSAVVGVGARLVDTASGAVVWTGSYSYEAMDLQGATQAVVGSLTDSLARLLPKTEKQPS